ncbi:MFS transporter [Nonomuraea spiralis]|uniref:MFS transporter n=1 Tax=Nonomuraea spiralis TaxID=46182 RepID=A0ABV5IXV2_9ACTN|nr:MFS transporter [Nonomuraea spiralis]GGS85235.1 MFS transporter [Nonomuraea spiralis]
MELTARRPAVGLAVLFTVALTTITTETLPMGLLPQMSDGLGASQDRIGWLVGGYSLVIIVITMPLATMTARLDRRRLLVLIMGLFAVGNALLAIAPNYPTALLARLVTASGHGVLWSAMAGYAASLVTRDKAGRAVAVVFAGNSAALTAGVPLGTLLGQAAGWRTGFAVLSGLSALLLVAARILLPEQSASPAPSGLRGALRLPSVRIVTAATALVMLGQFTLHTYLVPYLGDADQSGGATTVALFVFGAAGILGVWAAGLLADRGTGRYLLVTLGLHAAAIAVLPATGGAVTVAVIAVWGLAYAALPTLLQTFALKTAPHAVAAASTLFIIAFNLGITAGSTLGGQTLRLLGPGPLPVAAALPVLAAAATIAVGLHRARKPPRPAHARQTGAATGDPAAARQRA